MSVAAEIVEHLLGLSLIATFNYVNATPLRQYFARNSSQSPCSISSPKLRNNFRFHFSYLVREKGKEFEPVSQRKIIYYLPFVLSFPRACVHACMHGSIASSSSSLKALPTHQTGIGQIFIYIYLRKFLESETSNYWVVIGKLLLLLL